MVRVKQLPKAAYLKHSKWPITAGMVPVIQVRKAAYLVHSKKGWCPSNSSSRLLN
jgi:hypothetical protein